MHGLKDHIRPLAYGPCMGYVTSDHKPVRGAFTIKTNMKTRQSNSQAAHRNRVVGEV